MECAGERKALAVEFFTMTGEAVSESDPIVTGALFFSHKLGQAGLAAERQVREAGVLAAQEIREAGRLAAQEIVDAAKASAPRTGATVASFDASSRALATVVERMAADRSLIIKAIESQTQKFTKFASTGQSSPESLRYVPVWYAVVGSFVVGIALAAGWVLAVERGSTRAEEAAVGRSFARVVPALDPKVREQLMQHLRKKGS